MGALTSRQNAAIEESDVGSNPAYKFPPRSGNFFGSHFIMGGERFDTPQPEAYLFGENADLNFLGGRPTGFPYPPPQANEPTKTLKSLVNIRKESVRFVKAPDVATKIHGDGTVNRGNSFNIEFVFDSDAKCAITIYYFCTEEISPSTATYNSKVASLTSETYHYKRGVNQYFSQSSHIFNPSTFSDDELSYNTEKDVFPVAIHCVVEEGAEECRQSHTTICVIDHHIDGTTYVLRALKQKIFVDGLSYLLQEIYGIENKAINKPAIDDETDDNGSECVICMSDTRDTLILPCRHLCLCNSCADSLRYQANNCPICRAPFRALLQIRAVQKSNIATVNNISPQNPPDPNCEHIPLGYTAVSLIEALNGPPQCIGRALSTDGGDNEADPIQAVEMLNKSRDKKLKDVDKNKTNSVPQEIRMSALLTKEEKNSEVDSVDKLNSRENSLNIENNEKNIKDISSHGKKYMSDSVQIINEKNNTKLQSNDQDDDSDTENLSPLLVPHNDEKKQQSTGLQIDNIEDSIDDTDTDDLQARIQRKKNRPALSADGDGVILAGAEDSDYYTPEDPHTTILSPLCPEKSKGDDKTISKYNNTTISSTTTALRDNDNSLPDSPISGNSSSTKSSSDRYSSSSSTKTLLSSNQKPDSMKMNGGKERIPNPINA